MSSPDNALPTGGLGTPIQPVLNQLPPQQQGTLQGGNSTSRVSRIDPTPTSQTQINLPRRPRDTNRGSIQDPRISTPASAQKTGCSYGDVVKMIAVAAALASLVVGAAGLLVYLGKLQISWAGAGAISQQLGLYIMLGGLGLSAILTILLTIKCCMDRSNENKRQQRQLLQEQNQNPPNSSLGQNPPPPFIN